MGSTVDADSGDITEMAVEGHLMLNTVPADILPLSGGMTPCEFADGLGLPCGDCPDVQIVVPGPPNAGVEYAPATNCIPVHVTGITGSFDATVNLLEVHYADCHAECGELSEDCDMDTWRPPPSGD